MARKSLADLVIDDVIDDTSDETSAPNPEDSNPADDRHSDENETGTGKPKPRRSPRQPGTTVKKHGTVYTRSTVLTALTKYVNRRKAEGELVSYGVVSLQAVEEFSEELAQLWATHVEETGTGMFGITIRKKPPKKVPWQLHGATPDQVNLLDRKVDEWNAPSRSEVVEQALIRKLSVKV
ncbi:hypothetical protein [Mycobacteroides salmoniphilum]|uniref:Uncharacterized protein n=1 Tax=Mycobacteroides salmoniphilum TaxID=404941 RepID=A0A4R8SZY3_9MYCO|nr:hypothetical protein [Mycobacteroides salmoniphilum]TEA09163.1 hypothetical protein CCUG60884_00332 [Mycobacteroides salmoniphilum]